MRILRLGNSDDVSPTVPEPDRAYSVAGRVIENAVGGPVETIAKPIWPTEDLPGLVDRWLDKYRPDLVFLKVNWYWYGYESVPLRIERKLGRLGRPLARLGIHAADNRTISRNTVFKAGRRFAHRVIGGDSPFAPDVVIERMEQCIRRVASREDVVLLVKGTGGTRRNEAALEGYFDAFSKKRAFVEGSIEAFCSKLHVAYVGTGGPKSREDRGFDGGDGVHKNARGQGAMGRQEGEAMLRAWLDAHAVARSDVAAAGR